MNNPTFTDRCALERGLAIAEERAPLFSSHLAAIKENMERVARTTEQMNFPHTSKAMKQFAEGLRHE